MKVTLISYTPKAHKVCAAAAWNCTNSEPREPFDFSYDESCGLVDRVMQRGHTSIAEHASFTFSIEGISRACSHQLVRNRLASYSQQSQRYVKALQDTVVPDSIKNDTEASGLFLVAVEEIEATYTRLLQLGIPAEDARYILPNASKTNIVVTMNARELVHFFQQRLCSRAQWEIRAMAQEMRKLVHGPLFTSGKPMCDTCKDHCPR